MNKEINIVNYLGIRKTVVLEDIENINSIKVKIITGDEVLKVKYKDGHRKTFDSCPGERIVNFNDGEYNLPIKMLDKFSKCDGDSYDRMLKFIE